MARRDRGAQYVLGHPYEPLHRREHAACREWVLRGLRGGGPLCRGRPEAVLPESERPDPIRSVGPAIDGPLQAFQPFVWDGLGVGGLPAEH